MYDLFEIYMYCPIMISFVMLAITVFTMYIDNIYMEPHPIPQNVTTFQFHLVGDMTLKQFMYLAIGCGIAYILFVFFAHDYPVVTWPLIVISTLLGVAFAFLPVNSRPLDSWVKAFLKAIYSPTKRTWRKNNKSYQEEPTFNSRFVAYLSGLAPAQQIQTSAVIPIEAVAAPSPQPTSPTESKPKTPELPSADQLQKIVDLARQAQSLQMRIVQTERALTQVKSTAQNQTQIPANYTEQVNKILSDLQTLVTQASKIEQQIETVNQPEAIKSAPVPVLPKPQVKIIIPTRSKPTQVALTSFPNVINGIVKEFNGNYLEGVVVVIYDKEGLPVRALKTNKLGQFSGATPLPNGTYTVELEEEGFVFDILQVDLVGALLPPLIITAK